MNILEKFKHVKAIVMDVDGVLTDGKILLMASLEMARTMNIKDGYALQLAVKKGYQVTIISGASDEGAISNRLKTLGITDIHQGIADKAFLLKEKMQAWNLSKEEVLYIGDDIPDLKAMQLAGLACCPADAATEIIEIANYISPKKGGEGCVRDIIEKVLKLNNHWDNASNIISK